MTKRLTALLRATRLGHISAAPARPWHTHVRAATTRVLACGGGTRPLDSQRALAARLGSC